jgi:hypothetical protein
VLVARGVFEAGQNLTTNGPTRPFRYRAGTPDGGLWIFVASMAATGTWDGATLRFEFKLASEWHRTSVALTTVQRFWKIQDTAAIIGEAYRFVVEGGGPATSLAIAVASPRELVFDGGDP